MRTCIACTHTHTYTHLHLHLAGLGCIGWAALAGLGWAGLGLDMACGRDLNMTWTS